MITTTTTTDAPQTNPLRADAKTITSITAKVHPLCHWLQGKLKQSVILGSIEARLGKKSALSETWVAPLENPSLKALLLVELLQKTQKPLIVVCPDPQHVLRLETALAPLLTNNDEAVLCQYPTDIFSPYDQTALPVPILQEHYQFLQYLQAQQKGIYLVNAKSLLIAYPALAQAQAQGLTVVAEAEHAPEAIVAHLSAMGYYPTDLVKQAGSFSRRGDLLDVFPVNTATPFRLSFFGDTVESIREMDVETQRSVVTVEAVSILPRNQLVLTPTVLKQLPNLLEDRLTAQSKQLQGENLELLAIAVKTLINGLTQAFRPDGLDYVAPLVQTNWQTLMDAFPENSLVVLDEEVAILNHCQALSDRLDRQLAEGVATGGLLDLGNATGNEPFAFHHTTEAVFSALKASKLPVLRLLPAERLPADPELPKGAYHCFELAPLPRFQADIAKAVEAFRDYRQQKQQVVVVTDYPQRVLDVCKELDVPALYWTDAQAKPPSSAESFDIWVAKTGLPDGFHLPEINVVYLTDAELFGRHRMRRSLLQASQQGKRSATEDKEAQAIESLSDLRPGDYVVHIKHGIGQFTALMPMVMESQMREYLEIQYRGNDKVFLPVEQLHLLRRFNGTGEGAIPSLSKMGGADWKKVTAKVKKSIQNIAHELVALYKSRQTVEGIAFDVDSPWQVELEESFPYEETPDQWKAIQAMKADMESNKPMDRLVCGDVGFGKTEVALRGLFKSVLSGKQCAILVPTTILAQQHFNTVSERFAPYGVRVGLLSRFRSPKEQKDLLIKLKAGEIDVVVGTHRILQRDVLWKDLGLLVIDEEHRFGVAHKERIKQLRTQVDVLAMSATPIPRTLYMSLSGVREMSLIHTPPVNRLPVQTFVGVFNPTQLRMAILHELDRGGQIYYMHNRVQSIHDVAAQLQSIVPEAKICVAHGQMGATDLETVMLEFANHQFDVLVATTIIESGVDIPNANTLIIDDADRYGLAQLYQIRGRVGRSNVQAYAYLYYGAEKILTEDAKNRLRAIRELTALGSGYQIAMRDMEIRGVGNILGAEQHGHMIQIGFDMYCDLLNQAVEAAHDGRNMDEDDTKEPSVVDLNVTAFIPETYVGSQEVKLNEYRRLATVTTERGLDMIMAEWQDRFGKVPWQAQQLVELARLRVQATELAIPMVRSDDELLRITVPYTLKLWMGLQSKLPAKLATKLRWTAPANTTIGGVALPLLQYKHMGATSEALMSFVAQLFKELLALQRAGTLTQLVIEAENKPMQVSVSSTATKRSIAASNERLANTSQSVQDKNRADSIAKAEARAEARRRMQGTW
jgi:transcription-repair coupling factor (superfamily II helicase)